MSAQGLPPDVIGLVIEFCSTFKHNSVLELCRVSTVWMQAVAQQDWWWNGPDTLLLDLLDPMQCELAAARMALDGTGTPFRLTIGQYDPDGFQRFLRRIENSGSELTRILVDDSRLSDSSEGMEVLKSIASFTGATIEQLMVGELILVPWQLIVSLGELFPKCFSVALSPGTNTDAMHASKWIFHRSGSSTFLTPLMEFIRAVDASCNSNIRHVALGSLLLTDCDFVIYACLFPQVEVLHLNGGQRGLEYGLEKCLPRTVKHLYTEMEYFVYNRKDHVFQVMNQLPLLQFWLSADFGDMTPIVVVQNGQLLQNSLSPS